MSRIDPLRGRLGRRDLLKMTGAAAGVAALGDGDAEAFLDAVEAFWGELDQLGKLIGMPILSEEHRILRKVAVDCGVRYKPSGAGGGDFGIGFSTDAAAAAELVDRAASKGFRTLDLHVDSSGIECSS